MSEADEQLAEVLRRPADRRLWGVGPRDVEPSIHPGHVVLHKRCRCSLPSVIYLPGDDSSGRGFHHHLVEVPLELWRAISEERGWPQNRWIISGD